MREISVLTIVHQRKKALLNLVEGLQRTDYPPAELVVVYMNEASYELPRTPFPIRVEHIDHLHHLPLAGARNQAVRAASGENLVFLDADCLPHVDLLGHYATAFEQPHTLWAGHVRYLRRGADEQAGWTGQLDQLSSPDPIRTGLTSLPYSLFWSLNFGCTRTTFERIGGFDPGYTGYGAEDTDFAFRTRRAGVPLGLVPALAYHQYHPSYDPPLNHLSDIVTNAAYFHQHWGQWPMEGWLKTFAQRGLICWTSDHIELLRTPSDAELAAAIKP